MFIRKNNKKQATFKSGLVPSNPPAGGVVGFTLIELLVVIVIIGILATLATVALTSSRSNARDARRISDLKQISTGLELYYADNNAYPSAITFGSALVGANSKTYMAKVPTNPTPRAEGACADLEYRYAGSASDYSLIGCLAKASGEASAGARVLSVGGSARDLGPTNGIVGWWPLDGLYASSTTHTLDLSGNGNHGAITGATLTSNQLEVANKAYSFNGANDYISYAVANSYISKDLSYSVSFWAKFNSNTGSKIVISNTLNFTDRFSVYAYGGTIRVGIYDGVSISKSCPHDFNWHYYVAIWDGANVHLYQDSVPKMQTDTLTNSGTVGFTIGRRTDNVYFMDGSVSDVRVYNRALSQAEVTALWTATKP